jgi:beta-N-acetylhexosaminidase
MLRALAIVAAATCLLLAASAQAMTNGPPPPRPESLLTLRQLVGQRLVFSLPGTEIPARLRRRIRRGEAAGVILFARNIRSRRQVRRLVHRLQRIRRPRGLRSPLLVMLDQEGGLVKRLPGAPRRSAARLGRAASRRLARQEGRATARNLRRAGVNVNLAPVADVARPGAWMERTGRSFGRRQALVGSLTAQFAAGLRAGGVLATAKHFPGIGTVASDADRVAGRVRLSRTRLRRIDERPFAMAIARRVPLVMLSTAVYPSFGHRPALLSRRIATGELRGRLRFAGVSITDDLEVPALRPFGSPARLALSSARAGADLLLFARSYSAGAAGGRALIRAARGGRLARWELELSARRVLDLRASAR